MARVQFLESSTVGRSIVSMQEARVCDLENKLEFQRGQVKRFEVRMLKWTVSNLVDVSLHTLCLSHISFFISIQFNVMVYYRHDVHIAKAEI